jgi:hypothetical protein
MKEGLRAHFENNNEEYLNIRKSIEEKGLSTFRSKSAAKVGLIVYK